MLRVKRTASPEQLDRAWQNRQAKAQPVRLGQIVRALVRAEGLDKPSPLIELRSTWEELVGPELSNHSCLEGLRRGTLRVKVDSAPHMAELKILVQGGLAGRLAQQPQAHAVRTIRLRLGSQGKPATGSRRTQKKPNKWS